LRPVNGVNVEAVMKWRRIDNHSRRVAALNRLQRAALARGPDMFAVPGEIVVLSRHVEMATRRH
jgi:hypothetical protein